MSHNINKMEEPCKKDLFVVKCPHFELYDNSRARNIGNLGVGNLVPLDLNCNSRTADGQPDLGAYEYQ